MTADVVAREVFDVFHRVDIQMSRYRADSELSALNREAGKGPVNVSDGLFKVLQKAREVSELSEGAFDVTFGSVGYLYDFRAGKQPTDEQVATGLTRVNFRDVVLDVSGQTVAFRQRECWWTWAALLKVTLSIWVLKCWKPTAYATPG